MHDEIEVFKPLEFILIYPNHQHQLLQKLQVVHCQKLPHYFHHNRAPQIYPQIT